LGTAGNQYNGADLTEDTPARQPAGGNLPISQSYYDALQRINVDRTGPSDAELEAIVDAFNREQEAEVLASLRSLDDPFEEDYKIKKGDNLTKIAKANGTTVQALLKANPNIKNPNLIFAGETIKIPTNKTPTALPRPNNTDKDAFNQVEFDELDDPNLDEGIDDGTTELEDPDLDEDI
jgi:hypothetical protein